MGGRKLLAKLDPASKGYSCVMKMIPRLTKVGPSIRIDYLIQIPSNGPSNSLF